MCFISRYIQEVFSNNLLEKNDPVNAMQCKRYDLCCPFSGHYQKTIETFTRQEFSLSAVNT